MSPLKSLVNGFVGLVVIIILLLVVISLAENLGLGGTGIFWVVVLTVVAFLVVRKGNKKGDSNGTEHVNDHEVQRSNGQDLRAPKQSSPEAELRAQLLYISSKSGTEFEDYMAKVFRLMGYTATVLGGSGDQGVDLLLRKGGEFVAVQCKNHQRPVGNKPVQEVFAGKHHYKANAAWVVAPAGFTDGAFDIARSTGVLLFDSGSIKRFLQQAEEQRVEEERAEFAREQEQENLGTQDQNQREQEQRHLEQHHQQDQESLREQEFQRQSYEKRLEDYSDKVRYLEHYITSQELRYPQGFGSDTDGRHHYRLTMHELDYGLEIAHRDLERLEKRNPTLREEELFDEYAALKSKEQEIRERQQKLEAN